jgi:hypothetical protein
LMVDSLISIYLEVRKANDDGSETT